MMGGYSFNKLLVGSNQKFASISNPLLAQDRKAVSQYKSAINGTLQLLNNANRTKIHEQYQLSESI
jgi:hypothetical protein